MGDDTRSRRPVVPEGFEGGTRQLAVRQGSPRERSPRSSQLFGLVWCFIGSIFLSLAPIAASVLVSFGATIANAAGNRRERLVMLLVILVAGCASTALLLGPFNVPLTAISVVCAWGVADGYTRGRLNTGGLLLVAASVTCAMVGVDMVSTSLQGTSITELITTVVDEAVESSIGSLAFDSTQALLETRDALVYHWPTLYFAVGVSIVVCSLVGSWLGVRSSGMSTQVSLITTYDVPLWVAELFAVGVAAELLSPLLPSWQNEVAMAGANVVMCSRIALAQQGLSVLLWWMREHRARWSVRTLVVLSVLWLELSFALASVAGLLDVVVNFRRLERRRPDLFPRSA